MITTLTPPRFGLDTLTRLKQYRWANAAPIVLPLRRRHQGPVWPFRRGSCDRGTDLITRGAAGRAGVRREGRGVDNRCFVLSPTSLAKIFYMWDQDGESSWPEVFFMCDVSQLNSQLIFSPNLRPISVRPRSIQDRLTVNRRIATRRRAEEMRLFLGRKNSLRL